MHPASPGSAAGTTGERGSRAYVSGVLPSRAPRPRGIDVAFPALPESSPQVRRALRAFLESLQLEPGRIEDLVLAVGEAAGNAIEHAYRDCAGCVRLRARRVQRQLILEVRDAGCWRRESDPDRGHGLPIMRALVDRVSIESTRTGTNVRFEVDL